jgi:hypothetical protein
MKPLLLILLLPVCLSAQDPADHPFGRGSKLVGFSLNSDKTVSEAGTLTSTFSRGALNVQVGYFVMDGLVLGLDLTSASSTLEITGGANTAKSESTSGNTGLFAAYYFRLGVNGALYPEIRLFGGESTFTNANGRDVVSVGGASIGLGYAYKLNPHVGIDVKLRAGSQTERDKATSLETESGIASFFVGLQIWL